MAKKNSNGSDKPTPPENNNLPPLKPLDNQGFDAITREMAPPAFDIKTREMAPPPAERMGAKLAALAALAVGLGLGGYLTYTHVRLLFDNTYVSDCNFSTTLNCDVVNTSDYSELFGIPIALFAIPTYLVIAFLVGKSFRKRGEDEQVPLGLAFASSSLTVLTSFFLAGVSVFVLKTGCPFCMGMYAVNLSAFGLIWFASRQAPVKLLSTALSQLPSRGALVVQAALVVLVSFAGAFAAERGLQQHYLGLAMNAPKPSTAASTSTPGQASAPSRAPGQNPNIDADDAVYGPADAKVTLVEFADFECGYCKRMSYTVKSLKEKYGDNVRFVFKHFPMNPECNSAVKNKKHANACTAALAGQCANKLGKFWQFHDLTFKNQMNLEAADLVTYGKEVGIDPAALQACMSDPSTRAAIATDIEASRPLQITGTPRIYINGREFKGITPEQVLEQEILNALGDTSMVASAAPEKALVAADPTKAPAMVEIALANRRFLIDTFEASRGSIGQAVSAFDKAPYNQASWYDAKSACEAAGKRLCTAEEWIAACQNKAPVDDNRNGRFGDDLIEGTEFAYSDFYEPGACNDSQDDKTGRLAFTGNFPKCATPTGIFDLNGNVHEWVGADEDTALLIGGQYYAKEKASCFRMNDTFGPGYANKATGFRCCKSK